MTDTKIRIYRGLPGSGKNTHAEEVGHDEILDTDSFFVDEDGNYDFEPEKHGEAHAWCFRQYLQLLPDMTEGRCESIAVCNTNTTRAEYTPYVEAARAFMLGEHLRLVYCECSVETAIERNVHGVPPQTIGRMAERWEEPLNRDPRQVVINTEE